MIKRPLLSILVLLPVLGVPIFGSTINPDGTFYEFNFGTATSAVIGCNGVCSPTTNPVANVTANPPWTFSGAANFYVLDFGDVGDRWEAFDNGISLGATSDVINSGLRPCELDIACAGANPLYSSGNFALGAGPHSLTLNVIQNASGTTFGNAVFSVTATAVPEPGTFALLGAGLLALALASKRLTG